MISIRELLAVGVVCFDGDEVIVSNWFHANPSLIPDHASFSLVVALMSPGKMYCTNGFPTPEHRILMRKAFPRRGGNRE